MTTPEIEGITLQAAPAEGSQPKATTKANTAPKKPRVAPAKGKSTKKTTACQEAPKAKKAAKSAGNRRAARRQQDGPGGRDAPAEERRHAGGDHGQDGLAEAHRPRVHGRRDEEGRVHRRVLQTREGRAHLPDQPVASAPSSLARPAPAAAGFSASGPDSCRPVHVTAAWPTRQAVATGANVGQTWRNGGQLLGPPAVAAIPQTSPTSARHKPCSPDGRPESGLDRPRSPGGNVRFMLPPSGVPRRSLRTFARRLERGLLAGQRLPALHDDIHVLRIQLDAVADALGQFRRRERRSRSEERLVNQLARFGGSESGAASDRPASASGDRTSLPPSRP